MDIYNLPFSMFITRPNNYESNRLSYQDEVQYGLFREKGLARLTYLAYFLNYNVKTFTEN